MITLYQAEWCPHSRSIRQRLTELAIDYAAKQVPADREHRDELERITGARSIPALVTDDGSVIVGEDTIHAYFDTIDEPASAAAHRDKAATMRQREIQENQT